MIKTNNMRPTKLLIAFLLFNTVTYAQMDVPAVAGNVRATISEEVGITSITIKYSRPDVNKREGKIWGAGNVVTNGFSTFSFITNKNTAPWRAGANENTTISFEHDVVFEGKPVKAGTYGLHMAMYPPDSAVIILSNQTDAWGSFYYEEKYDALRVNVKPVALEKSVEWLKYEFTEHKEKSCVVAMQWEKLAVPFNITVDVDNIVLARLREQVTGIKNFNSTNMLQAAQFCLNKNINLEEALQWSIRAINGFQGQKSFVSLRNLATAYDKLNRLVQSDSVMNEALTMASVNQYVGYARALIPQKRLDKAAEVVNGAKTKFGDVFAVNNTMAFVYSAKADFTEAIKHAEKALAQAPNDNAKKTVEGNLAKLKEGKDINQ
jgi:tetratricopeptide (TPR) repeat protein